MAKYIVLSNIISVVSDNILRIGIQETLLISKKNIVLLHNLWAYNSLLIRYKIYSSHPRECLCTQPEGMLKAMKTLVLIQPHVEKIPIKNKIVIPNCQSLPLGEYYTEIIAWQIKFALSDLYFYKKCHWNKSVTAKVSLENLARNVLTENKLWNRTFKSAVW